MRDRDALRIALHLFHVPSRVRMLQSAPLPQGVTLLLRIAADDSEAVQQAMHMTDRSREVVQDAATFFVEQIVLCPEADSYRLLGADSEASSTELRRNMAWLMKWLHPDSNSQGPQSIFVNRVTMAWEDLKTPERRAAYERRRAQGDKRRVRRKGRSKATMRINAQTRSRHGLLRALWYLVRNKPSA